MEVILQSQQLNFQNAGFPGFWMTRDSAALKSQMRLLKIMIEIED